jgi:uncharacterized protein (TIGR02453 family)
MPTQRFTGFPPDATRFYRQLEANNSKSFWDAHKSTFEVACREPMQALLEELESEFGPGKMFRPYRDVRFSPDKSPYKTNCSAMIGDGGYVEISANGLYVGGGRHTFDAPALARYREAVAADAAGRALASVVAKLKRQGYEVGGEALRAAPRGYPADHPRIELLRYKGLHAGRAFAADPSLHTRGVLPRVRRVLRDVAPLVEWLDAHAG